MSSSPRDDDWFRISELATRTAQLMWVETEVANLLDGWSRIEDNDETCTAMAAAARHHKWHADLLAECRPTSEALLTLSEPHPPTPGWAAAIATLTQVDDPSRTVTRLNAMVRHIDPWLTRETEALLAHARPIAEADLIRWVGFIELDHRNDAEELRRLLGLVQTNTVSLADRSLLAGIDLSVPPD